MKILLLIILWPIAITFAAGGTYLCFCSGIIGLICLPINIIIICYLGKWITALNKDENED